MSSGARWVAVAVVLGCVAVFAGVTAAQVGAPGVLQGERVGEPAADRAVDRPEVSVAQAADPVDATGAAGQPASVEAAGASGAEGQGAAPTADGEDDQPAPQGALDAPSIVFTHVPLLELTALPLETKDIDASAAALRARLERLRAEAAAFQAAVPPASTEGGRGAVLPDGAPGGGASPPGTSPGTGRPDGSGTDASGGTGAPTTAPSTAIQTAPTVVPLSPGASGGGTSGAPQAQPGGGTQGGPQRVVPTVPSGAAPAGSQPTPAPLPPTAPPPGGPAQALPPAPPEVAPVPSPPSLWTVGSKTPAGAPSPRPVASVPAPSGPSPQVVAPLWPVAPPGGDPAPGSVSPPHTPATATGGVIAVPGAASGAGQTVPASTVGGSASNGSPVTASPPPTGERPAPSSPAVSTSAPPRPSGDVDPKLGSPQMVLGQLAPFVPFPPPLGPGKPYFPEDPTILTENVALAKSLDDHATDLRARLEGVPTLRESLEAELFSAVAREWACGAPGPTTGASCRARRAAVDAARARLAIVAIHVEVARAELSLVGAQRDWIQRLGDWGRSEAQRKDEWDRTRIELERKAAAEQAAKRAEAEAAAAETARLAQEKAARDAEELAKQKQQSLAALEKAKSDQERFLLKQKAEEDQRQRDRELAQLYQEIVDVTGKQTSAIEELTKRSELREIQREKAKEFIDFALKEDIHTTGLIRKVKDGELEAKVLDAKHEEFAQRLDRARAALGDSGLDDAEARVETATAELRSRNGDVEVSETETVKDVELHTKRLELVHIRADLAQTNLDATVAERDRIAIVADLRKAERIYYSSLLRRIAPYLSSEYRAKVLAVGGSFAEGLFKNLIDLGERLTDLLRWRLDDLRELPTRLSSWKGATAVVWYMGELAVLLLVALWARKRLPMWMVQLVQGAGSNPWLRRNLPIVVMVAKVINAIGRPFILLLASHLIGRAMGATIPEVAAALFAATWFFSWRMFIELLRVLFLPAEPPKDGEPETLASIDPAPIIRITGPQAETAYRSAWGMLHYLILRNAVLIGVEALLGRFYLYRGMTNLFDLGFAVLAVYLMLAWRSALLGRFAAAAPPTWGRLIAWVKRNQDTILGVVAVPPIVVWLLLVRAWPFLRQKLRESSASRSMANYLLRRRMERAKDEAETETSTKRDERAPAGDGLPEDFTRYFELTPLVDEPWLVPQDKTIDTVLEMRAAWEPLPTLGAVGIAAEPGLGKTTILNRLERRLPPGSVRRLHFDRRVRTERQLIIAFAEELGLDEVPTSLDELRDRIMDAPETTWLIDDAHRLFLKVIGGMEALDAFFDLIAATCRERFWVVTFDSFTWYFIQSLRKGRIPFARVLMERKWSEEQVQELVMARTRAAGYEVTFEDLVVTRGDDGAAATYQVVKTAEGYYRLLCDYADGNPAIVLNYWLRSLTPRGGRQFSVGLFGRRSAEMLIGASDDMLFTFTSIAEHSGMPIPDLARVLGYEEALVERYIRRGIEGGLLAQIGTQPKDRVVIHFDAFRQVISLLRAKNFIYFSHKE